MGKCPLVRAIVGIYMIALAHIFSKLEKARNKKTVKKNISGKLTNS